MVKVIVNEKKNPAKISKTKQVRVNPKSDASKINSLKLPSLGYSEIAGSKAFQNVNIEKTMTVPPALEVNEGGNGSDENDGFITVCRRNNLRKIIRGNNDGSNNDPASKIRIFLGRSSLKKKLLSLCTP